MYPWLSMSVMTRWFLEVDRASPMLRMDRGQLDFRPLGIFLDDGARELESGSLAYSRQVPALISAAEDDFKLHRGFGSGDATIVVTHGIIGALSCVFQRLLQPGDEVLVPAPIWPALPSLVCSARGIPIAYPFATADDACGLVNRLESLCSSRTKMIIINTPSNPSGIVLEHKDVVSLLDRATTLGLRVVWDDAYESFGPKGGEARILNAAVPGAQNVILLCSFSKRFGAPALRVGLIRAPNELGAELWDECLLQTGGIGRICQAAAAGLLRSATSFEKEAAEIILSRRAAAYSIIGSERLINGGSGLFVMSLVPAGSDGWQFARAVLAHGIGTVPGEVFGIPNTLRLSLTVDRRYMEEVGKRFEQAWTSLEAK